MAKRRRRWRRFKQILGLTIVGMWVIFVAVAVTISIYEPPIDEPQTFADLDPEQFDDETETLIEETTSSVDATTATTTAEPTTATTEVTTTTQSTTTVESPATTVTSIATSESTAPETTALETTALETTAAPTTVAVSTASASAEGCHPAYRPCLEIVGDLNCGDIPRSKKPVTVIGGSDPYRLDGDSDGVGCEL